MWWSICARICWFTLLVIVHLKHTPRAVYKTMCKVIPGQIWLLLACQSQHDGWVGLLSPSINSGANILYYVWIHVKILQHGSEVFYVQYPLWLWWQLWALQDMCCSFKFVAITGTGWGLSCLVCSIFLPVAQNPVTNFEVHCFWEIVMADMAASMLSQLTREGSVC